MIQHGPCTLSSAGVARPHQHFVAFEVSVPWSRMRRFPNSHACVKVFGFGHLRPLTQDALVFSFSEFESADSFIKVGTTNGGQLPEVILNMCRGFDSQLRTSQRLELQGTLDTSTLCATKFAEHVLLSRKTFRWWVLEHCITEVVTCFRGPNFAVRPCNAGVLPAQHAHLCWPFLSEAQHYLFVSAYKPQWE